VPATPDVVFEAPITYDVGGGQATHAPMVRATVGGVPTKLILDTGSDTHLLTIELAREAGLEGEPGEPGIDSAGASVPSWALGEVSVRIEEADFDLHGVVAITAPAPFPGWGIGGILSPQLLHPDGWAVLDLAADRLFLVDAGEADLADWLTGRAPTTRLLRLERQPGEGTIQVQAAIYPRDPVVTLLDTGAKRTQFVRSAVAAAAGGPRVTTGHGVGGSASSGSEVRDQALAVGGTRLPLPALIVADDARGPAGLVGMDVLRGTVLAVSADPERRVLWQLPPAPSSPE